MNTPGKIVIPEDTLSPSAAEKIVIPKCTLSSSNSKAAN